MKFFVVNCLLLVTFFSFSQEKKRSYYFDYYTITSYKDFGRKIDSEMVNLSNEKDSTYTLQLNYSSKEAVLIDRKKNQLIKFIFDFKFDKIESLNKLTNSKLYTEIHTTGRRRFKNFVEDFEYENDSLTGKMIVHLTTFKNNKRKKIINEHYYYFGNNEKTRDYREKSLHNYFFNKNNLKEVKNLNLEKVLHLKDGKI